MRATAHDLAKFLWFSKPAQAEGQVEKPMSADIGRSPSSCPLCAKSRHYAAQQNSRPGDDPADLTTSESADYGDGSSEREICTRLATRHAVRRHARDDRNLVATVRHSISDPSSNGLLRKPTAPASSARVRSFSLG